MFIELREYYYDRGKYLTRALAVNVEEISDIFETNRDYNWSNSGGVRICLKNGHHHDVKESYKEIMEKINT